MTTPRLLQNGHSTDYGCGLGIRRRMHQTVWQHSGAVAGFLAVDAMLPESKSAVVVLTNTESIDPHELADHLLQLVVEDVARAEVPKVDGPPPEEVALQMIHALRSGTIDRSKLGDELSRHLTDERLEQARAFLTPLGDPRIEVTSLSERGGMEVAWMKLHFRDRDVDAPLFRTPDGKIQEFLIVR